MVKSLDRKQIEELTRELKENVQGKTYFKTLKPKLKFAVQLLKLIFADITKHKPFRSKRKVDSQSGTSQT